MLLCRTDRRERKIHNIENLKLEASETLGVLSESVSIAGCQLRHGQVQACGMVWNGMEWYGMVWNGMETSKNILCLNSMDWRKASILNQLKNQSHFMSQLGFESQASFLFLPLQALPL